MFFGNSLKTHIATDTNLNQEAQNAPPHLEMIFSWQFKIVFWKQHILQMIELDYWINCLGRR